MSRTWKWLIWLRRAASMRIKRPLRDPRMMKLCTWKSWWRQGMTGRSSTCAVKAAIRSRCELNISWAQVGRRQAEGNGLKTRPDVVQLVDVSGAELPHPEPTAGVEVDELIPGQSMERLPDRGSAHPELRRPVDVREPFAGSAVAGQEIQPDCFVGMIDRRQDRSALRYPRGGRRFRPRARPGSLSLLSLGKRSDVANPLFLAALRPSAIALCVLDSECDR